MAASIAPVSVSGGCHLKRNELLPTKSSLLGKPTRLTIERKSNQVRSNKLAVRAAQNDDRGGGEFMAGFVLGGAVFGTLAYLWAPQIRRAIRHENEHGFVSGRRPLYYDEYDEGLEKTKRTLNEKLSQLNSAIEKVSAKLTGRKTPPVPVMKDADIDCV